MAQSFNLYSIEWSPHRIQFAVNDAAIWTIDGQSLCAGARAAEVDADKSTPKRLPFEPMSVRVILRPRGREYLPPPTHMDVASFNFKPAVLADSVPAEPVVVERASLSSSGGRKSRPSLLALALGCVLVMHMVS